MRQVLRRLPAVFLPSLMLGLAAVPIYWRWFDTVPPLRYIETETFDGGTIKPGQPITPLRSFCTDRPEINGVAVREVTDLAGANIYYLPNTINISEPGCHERLAYKVPLPEWLPDGRYLFKLRIQYAMNPMRTLTVIAPDITFEVKR